jgi:hypothetical protein
MHLPVIIVLKRIVESFLFMSLPKNQLIPKNSFNRASKVIASQPVFPSEGFLC